MSRPIVLFDGKSLIKTCIDNDIGFDFIPRINKDYIVSMSRERINPRAVNSIMTIDDEIDRSIINKQISNNDIRARILRLPKDIKISLDILNKKKITANVNGIKNIVLTVDSSKTYLAGVTELYREYNLITANGTANSKVVKMYVDRGVLNLIFDEN